MNDEEVDSVVLVDRSNSRMEGLNCLNLIFLMILKLEQAQRRIFINTFMLKINITFNLSLACLQNEDHGQKQKCSTRPQFWGTMKHNLIFWKFWTLAKMKNMMNKWSVFLDPNSGGLFSLTDLTEVLDVCKNEKYDEKQNFLLDS